MPEIHPAPLVSIVIPVYNGSNYLGQAIDSALAQTYPNIEIIVVNDGSNDNGATEKIALSYGDKVRYFSKKNGGVASALNFAILRMSGEYFSWLSHDELYYPDKVSTQVSALAKTGWGKTIIYCDYEIFTENSGETIAKQLPEVPPEGFRYFITINSTLNGCTLLIPASAFAECGAFNEKLRTTQDYDQWYRMASKFRFIHLPGTLVKSRLHPQQGSVTLRGKAMEEECNALLTNFVDGLTEAEITSITRKSIGLSYAEISANFIHRRFMRASRHAASLAIRHMFSSSLTDTIRLAALLLRGYFAAFFPLLARQLQNISRMIRNLAMISDQYFHNHLKRDGNLSSNLKERFSQIYYGNMFGGMESRSGEGSNMVQTSEIRRELPKLLHELGIKTLLDAPCGDWHWMKATPSTNRMPGFRCCEPPLRST